MPVDRPGADDRQFSVINAVLFRSMPGIRDQAQLRHVWMGALGERGPEIVPPTPQDYETFRASLADVAEVMGAVQTPMARALRRRSRCAR